MKSLLLHLKEINFLYNDVQVNLENIPKVLLNLDQADSMAQLLSDIDKPIVIVLENEPNSIERENEGDEFQISVNKTTLVY